MVTVLLFIVHQDNTKHGCCTVQFGRMRYNNKSFLHDYYTHRLKKRLYGPLFRKARASMITLTRQAYPIIIGLEDQEQILQ